MIFKPWHLVVLVAAPAFPPVLLFIVADMIGTKTAQWEARTPNFPVARTDRPLPAAYYEDI